MTLGHEVAGRVLEVGAGVDDTGPTGTRFVLKGTLQGPRPGLGDDGGLAERVLVPASYLMPIPDGIGMGQAAVATESVATAYHAVKDVGGVRLGETVGIIGLGGLGLNAVSIAAMAGAWGSKRQELAEVLDLIAAGRISSVLEEISLDEVPEGYARLHRGEVPGRLVAMIDQADGHNRKATTRDLTGGDGSG
jgi:D-arabinose 1-dehydrogenase-like Zn-dependent alcohol dehydrogenase